MIVSSKEYLSLNEKISPEFKNWQAPSKEELEEMKSKDPQLRSNWAIWEQVTPTQGGKAGEYADTTHRVATFNTVKGFWTYWGHLPQPSELLDGKKLVREQTDGRVVVAAIMLFKEGIRPEWEDRANAEGGHFQFHLKPQIGGGQIDEYWNNIVLGMVGGTIEPSEILNGVRLVDKLGVNRQSAIRIEVWFSNYDDTEKVDQLQKNLEKCMSTKLSGEQSSMNAWGKIDRKPHKQGAK